MKRVFRGLSSSQIILLSFAALILIGTLLLSLPFSTRSGKSVGGFDALFTATSSACVTGLVVRDTAQTWSVFGQVVILLLIQFGGLGLITAVFAVALMTGKKIGLRQRSTMQEVFSAPNVGGIVRLTSYILKMTLFFELFGALALTPVFIPRFGVWKGIWFSLFHAVSAFCNAGFDLMGAGSAFSSLTAYADSVLVNCVMPVLIIVGGIGFLIWDDVRRHKLHMSKYCMQTKVVLLTTSLLILIPAVYLFFAEFRSGSIGGRLMRSVFQAVTPRTAGFNTVDYSSMKEASLGLTIVLMLVGGSPGSTAGGFKTTTLATLLALCNAVFRRRQNVSFFGRRLTGETLRRAATLLVLYLTLFLLGGFCISLAEGLPLLDCLFETASAVGTVGLSLGLTPQLGAFSRIILIALMFIGRIGGLTLLFSTLRPGMAFNYPQESLAVG